MKIHVFIWECFPCFLKFFIFKLLSTQSSTGLNFLVSYSVTYIMKAILNNLFESAIPPSSCPNLESAGLGLLAAKACIVRSKC